MEVSMYVCNGCGRVFKLRGSNKKVKCTHCDNVYLIDMHVSLEDWQNYSKEERSRRIHRYKNVPEKDKHDEAVNATAPADKTDATVNITLPADHTHDETVNITATSGNQTVTEEITASNNITAAAETPATISSEGSAEVSSETISSVETREETPETPASVEIKGETTDTMTSAESVDETPATMTYVETADEMTDITPSAENTDESLDTAAEVLTEPSPATKAPAPAASSGGYDFSFEEESESDLLEFGFGSGSNSGGFNAEEDGTFGGKQFEFEFEEDESGLFDFLPEDSNKPAANAEGTDVGVNENVIEAVTEAPDESISDTLSWGGSDETVESCNESTGTEAESVSFSDEDNIDDLFEEDDISESPVKGSEIRPASEDNDNKLAEHNPDDDLFYFGDGDDDRSEDTVSADASVTSAAHNNEMTGDAYFDIPDEAQPEETFAAADDFDDYYDSDTLAEDTERAISAMEAAAGTDPEADIGTVSKSAGGTDSESEAGSSGFTYTETATETETDDGSDEESLQDSQPDSNIVSEAESETEAYAEPDEVLNTVSAKNSNDDLEEAPEKISAEDSDTYSGSAKTSAVSTSGRTSDGEPTVINEYHYEYKTGSIFMKRLFSCVGIASGLTMLALGASALRLQEDALSFTSMSILFIMCLGAAIISYFGCKLGETLD